MITGS